MNVVTGAIASANVNIDMAVTLGKEQLETFESTWPEGFYTTIKGQIVTFSATRKSIKVGDIHVIDQEAIYAIFDCEVETSDTYREVYSRGRPVRGGGRQSRVRWKCVRLAHTGPR